jgi:DNA (cytosine-5)-methyltransferase 1
LESEGGKLQFALERSPMAAETFMRNLVSPNITDLDWQRHLGASMQEQVGAGLVVADVTTAKNEPAIRNLLESSELDLIVGGPPCQGFSLAGRRNLLDRRNSLAWDFLDYVDMSNPRMVVIENVLGMNSKFAKQEENSSSVYNQVAEALELAGTGYVVQKLHLNALHYGTAQNRERLFLVGLRRDLASKLKIIPNRAVWKSTFSDLVTDLPDLAPRPVAMSTDKLTVRDAIGDLHSGEQVHRYVKTLQDAAKWGLSPKSTLENDKWRRHGETTIKKFELYLALKNLNLSPLLLKDGLSEKLELAREKAILHAKETLTFPMMGTKGEFLASSFEEFEELLKMFRTRKHSQRVLSMESVPPTVITSPDDYLHPLEPRVLTVRELARFQGFSDHFVFFAKETTGGIKRRIEVPQYSQVGNAVSPFVSKAIGSLVKKIVADSRLH